MSFRNNIVVAGLLTLACGDVPVPAAQEPVQTPVMAASSTKTCGTTLPAVVTDEGVGHFVIGESVAQIHEKCNVIADTTLEIGAEGLPEHRLAVLIGPDTLEATVVSNHVWRIEVRSPRVLTTDGLGVGTKVETLRLLPVEYLGYGEGGPFLKVQTHCGLSFEISEFPGFARTFADVPDTAAVSLVLVVGCGTKSGAG